MEPRSRVFMGPAEVGVSAARIFAILNPMSVIPIFLSLTEGRSEAELRMVMKVTSIAIFATTTLFSLAGEWILRLLGVTVTELKLGGGRYCSCRPWICR